MNYKRLSFLLSRAMRYKDENARREAVNMALVFAEEEIAKEGVIPFDYGRVRDLMYSTKLGSDKELQEFIDYAKGFQAEEEKAIQEFIKNFNVDEYRPQKGKNDDIDKILMRLLNRDGQTHDKRWNNFKSMLMSYSSMKRKRPTELALMRLGLMAILKRL